MVHGPPVVENYWYRVCFEFTQDLKETWIAAWIDLQLSNHLTQNTVSMTVVMCFLAGKIEMEKGWLKVEYLDQRFTETTGELNGPRTPNWSPTQNWPLLHIMTILFHCQIYIATRA